MIFDPQPAKISNVRPLSGRKMIALFSVLFRSGANLHYNLLQYMDDMRTLQVVPPRIPKLDFGGRPIKDAAGRAIFDSCLTFKTQAAREHYQATCLYSLRQQHPELFRNMRG